MKKSTMDGLKSRFLGSLVGTAVGDSLGAGGKKYTDDTAMMIGIAESLIENKSFDADHMAQIFVRNYDAEPWRGYGPGPPRIFKLIKSGSSWKEAAENIYPGGSYGNGSAMRIAPIGLFYYDNPEKLREFACKSSKITHTHVLGIEGAVLQAYSVALAARTEPFILRSSTTTENGDQRDKYDFLNKLRHFVEVDVYREKLKSMETLLKEAANQSDVIVELGNTVEAFNSVPVAIYSFLANLGFKNALNYALSLGGDRDTISAMTGAIAGACYGMERIPKEWMDSLENRDYIEGLAEKLWQIKIQRSTAK